MKYWLLTTEYPPFYGGGISTYCSYTTRMLAAQGHQVTVFVPDISISADIISESPEGIRVIRFATNKTGMQAWLGFDALISYEFAHTVGEYLSKEARPDIVEIQDYHGIGYYLLMFKHLGYVAYKDLKILITIHATALLYMQVNKEAIYELPTYWMGEMEKFSILASDLRIACSSYIVDKLAENFRIRDKQVNVVPNPIQKASVLPDFSFERNNIVFFGKMVYMKGGFHLIEYFKSLWEEGFSHPLKIIGDTDFVLHSEGILAKDYIRKKYGKYIKAGLLQMTGKLPFAEAQKHLSKAHVVIIPSLIDNLPYTVLETMQQGKIVLASQQGGQIEVIEEGKDGFLFDHSLPSSFSGQLKRILALTDEEIHLIGKNAFWKISNQYNPSVIYEKKIRLIEKFLQEGPTSNNNFPYINPVQLKVSPESLALKTGIKGLLSVIIPFCDPGSQLQHAVESIINATWKEVEILIINNGNTDPVVLTTLKNLEARFPEVRVLQTPHTEISELRNFGAAQAKGEYLAYLEANDRVATSYHEKAIKVLQQSNNVHFVGCWSHLTGKTSGYNIAVMPEVPLFLVHNTMNSTGLVFRLASFLSCGNDENMTTGLEDWECTINMSSQGMTGVTLPEALFYQNITEQGRKRKPRVKSLFLYSRITNKHHDFYADHITDLLGILNANGSGVNMKNPILDNFTGFFRSAFINKLLIRLRSIVGQNYYLKKIALKLIGPKR